MKFIKSRLVLVVIIALAFFLRFYNLTTVPPGFNWDEAAVGYNAYSLALTGKDEFSRSWPLFIESFGDFKTGLYSWLAAPIVAQFGLSVFNLRILNVLIGTSLVVVMYWFGQLWFKQDKFSLSLALISAVSPLAVHLSRFTLEWYAALPIFILGLGLVLPQTPAISFDYKKWRWRLPLGALLLGFSLYWYHSLRLVLPLLLLAFTLIYKKILWQHKKTTMIGFLVGLIVLMPLLIAFKRLDILARPQAVAIFSNQEEQRQQIEGLYRHTVSGLPLRRVLTNKGVYYGREIMQRYLAHFSLEFLFFGQDATPRLSIEHLGKLQLTLLPFLLLGTYQLIKRKTNSDWLLLAWLLISPLPASVTADAPHGLRSLVMIPALWVIIVEGIQLSSQWLDEIRERLMLTKITQFLFFSLLIFESILIFHYYYLFYPESTADFWQAGQQMLVNQINQLESKYQQVIITTADGQPHIFLAFFTPLDPAWYQTQVINQNDAFNTRITNLGKYIFRQPTNTDYCLDNALIVRKGKLYLGSLKPIATVALSNRFHQEDPTYYIYDTNQPVLRENYCED